MNATLLWLLAVIIAIVGVFELLAGHVLFGILLFVVAAAVGPGGWSIFGRSTTR